MRSLHKHLADRLAASFRQLRRSLDGLPPEDAARGARPDWRRARFGTGLDGSIQGIVRHVAAWKLAAAEGLEGGAFPGAEDVLPPGTTWAELLEWLESGQERLALILERLPPGGLEETVTWEGQAMSLADLFAHLMEHDQYHAGQVNLLRQQREHPLPGVRCLIRAGKREARLKPPLTRSQARPPSG
jgi:uncharacterized damage-inducible protein DinB